MHTKISQAILPLIDYLIIFIYSYINNYVYDMFDGKISYKDGKTIVVPSKLTVDEEYANALSALNRIIEKYV